MSNFQIVNLRKFYREMMEDITVVLPECKKRIIKYYKTKASLSDDEFVQFMASWLNPHMNHIVDQDNSLMDGKEFLLTDSMPFSEFWEKLSDANKKSVWNYLSILSLNLLMSKKSGDSEESDPESSKKDIDMLMKLMGNMHMNNISTPEVPSDSTDSAVGGESSNDSNANSGASKGAAPKMGKLIPDMIQTLAEEISKDESIKNAFSDIKDPGDVFAQLFNSSKPGAGQALGKVVGKITETIQGKIQNGELNEKMLVEEATNMMSSMFGDNAGNVQDMMKNMAGMMGGPGGKGGKGGMDPMKMMQSMMGMFQGGLGGMGGMGGHSHDNNSHNHSHSHGGNHSHNHSEDSADKEKRREELKKKLRAKYHRK